MAKDVFDLPKVTGRPPKDKRPDIERLREVYQRVGRTVAEQVASALKGDEEFNKFEAWAKLTMMHYANVEVALLDENIPLEKRIQWGRDLANMVEGSRVIWEDKVTNAPTTEAALAKAMEEKALSLLQIRAELAKQKATEDKTAATIVEAQLGTTYDA